MTACGGCGETNPQRRCLGCLHDFGNVAKRVIEQPGIVIEPFSVIASAPPTKFQASIRTADGGFHHGIGETEAEALVMASVHWMKRSVEAAGYAKAERDRPTCECEE